MIRAAAVLLAATLIAAGVVYAVEPATQTVSPASSLDALTPFVDGEYAIDATWAGTTQVLRARQTWHWGVNRKFIVCKVYVQKTPAEGGGEYQRYETVFYDDHGVLSAVNMDFTGHVRTSSYARDGNVLTEVWTVKDAKGNDARMKQVLTLKPAESYRWQVQMQPAPGPDAKWVDVMDGEWKKKG